MFRVQIIDDRKNSTWMVGQNFSLSAPTPSDLANSLIELSREWTSICIANVGVSADLAFVGGAILESYIKEQLLPFMTQIAIAHEAVDDEDEEKVKYSFIVDREDVELVSSKLATVEGLDHASNSKSQAHLGTIISDFEFFLLRVATEFSKENPNRFIQMDEKISVGEVFAAGDIDNFLSQKIDKKIRNEMRGSHYDMIKWLHTTLELGSFDPVERSSQMKDFLECCQRRHLFTHAGGIVNDTYLSKCDEYGIDMKSLPKAGDKLSVTPQYLRRASGRAYLLGIFILHMAIQKMGKSEREASLSELLSISHELLKSGNTKLAERVIDFVENSKHDLPNQIKLSFAINRALAKLHNQALTEVQQAEEVEKVLAKYDWSVVTPVFDLALACVRRNFDEIISLANAAKNAGLRYTDARTFFAFKEARKIDGFLDCFPKKPLAIENTGESPDAEK